VRASFVLATNDGGCRRTDRATHRARLIVVLAAIVFVAGTCTAAGASELYQAQTIVTGQREPERNSGFARCLEDVLVKVSGDPRLIGDHRLQRLEARAAAFVTDFSYRDRMAGIPVHDEQGTRDRPYDLNVTFDPSRIDAALTSLGRAPWRAARPRLAIFLGVRNEPTSYVLTSEGQEGFDQRLSMLAAADKRGMRVVLPPAYVLAAAKLDVDRLGSGELNQLDSLAKEVGGDIALAGRVMWSDRVRGWIADWHLAWQGETYNWHIAGVSFDNAFRNAMEGALQILSGHGRPRAGVVRR
jgi:uncharacterized protein